MYMKGCLWWVVGRGWEGWRLRGGTEWSALGPEVGGGVDGGGCASREGGRASGLLAVLGKRADGYGYGRYGCEYGYGGDPRVDTDAGHCQSRALVL